MNHINDSLLSVEDLCKELSIGRNTAYKLLNTNAIKAFRIGSVWKIRKSALEEYIRTDGKGDVM